MTNRSSDYNFHNGNDSEELSIMPEYPEDVIEVIQTIQHRAEQKAIGSLTPVMRDLVTILTKSPKAFMTLATAIKLHPASYSNIATELGVTKQAVHKNLKKLSALYPWIERLMDIKGYYGR